MRTVTVILLSVVGLASCAERPPPRSAIPPPPGPQRCQDGMAVPRPPRPPRTVEQLGTWALTAERAARQTERARAACAEDYILLREWAETITG
jgi:hypothetical protein